MVDRHAREEQFHREGVPEAMGMPTSHVCDLEELPEGTLPVCDRRFGKAVAGPEEVARMDVRDLIKCRDDVGRQRHEVFCM